MSALRALVLVGLVAVVACNHAAREPQHASAIAPAPQARLDLGRTYATLLEANIGVVQTRPSYALALAPTCRTSADCGGAALSCRAREDGVRVCMGLGSRGDACWFNTDCVSGTCALDADQRTCR